VLRGGLAVVVAVGVAACATTAPPPPAAAPPPAARLPVDRLSLEQQVGQTLILSFAGLREPGYVARILARRRAAGVILSAENVASPGQVRALTRSLERSGGGRALVGADQEGGAIRTLPFAAPAAAQAGEVGRAAAGAAARASGRDLRRLGLDVDFAPVADVAVGRSIMRSRAYPGAAGTVAASVRAAVAGYAASGVAATVKHFPGLGAAGANTDDAPVTIAASGPTLRARELAPFRAAIAAGVPLVMASHAVYPALDPDRIASQSPLVLDRLLRGSLGFGGVVITDSIEAAAVRRRGSVADAAVRSLAAGADLVLMTGPGSYHLIYPRLVAEARRSPAFRRRVREAAGRVLALERRLERPG
jgi:beta-N-acetylhexosaminidase